MPAFIDNKVFEKGECEIPKWLKKFWISALGGLRKKTPKIERLSSCFAQDSIYNISNGAIKPTKHITLGIGMKSITGNKKVINVLNRLGYCLSYTKISEMETSAAYSRTSKKRLTPSGIECTPTLSSGVAWNNFDRFVETSSGKNTLHDTVGIICQDIPTDLNIENINQDNEPMQMQPQNISSVVASGRKRRSFEHENMDELRPAKMRRPEFSQSTLENVEVAETPPNLFVFQHI